jgi:uncharacterized protein (TIGR03437 family)
MAQQSGVIVTFDPSTPSIGPFPSDYLTTPDSTQNTGLVVQLPMPDCNAQPSECATVAALNQLDGFALQPRMVVNFSDAIDPATLQAGVLFVWLDNLTTAETGLGPSGQLTAINQVIYDPATNTAYARPNDFFDQHRRYALVVTDAVLDTMGNPVGPDPAFTACIQSPQNAYCTLLQQVVSKLGSAALPGNIVAASEFTTMSATAWLEAARDLLPQVPVGFQSAGASVKTAGITAITLNAQVADNPVAFQTFTEQIPAALLTGLDRMVFGTYQSPNFLNAGQYIPITPTAAALTPPATNTLSFHAYIPSSPMPASGYPVVLYGHGFGDNSFLEPTLVASSFAQAGFVTMAINAVGHGYGPQSVIELAQGNVVVDFPEGGRGVDLNGDGQITATDGCFLTWPYPAVVRDCLRQTAVDLMQLENLVSSGTAIEPSTGLKLDPSKIYYAGDSFGGMYGAIFHALDLHVPAAVLNVGGGSPVDIARWSPIYHSLAQEVVAQSMPSLLNAGSDYNENYVLRDQPAKVNNVAGAIDIQNLFGELAWLQASGDPLSYAPHLSLTPLPNVPAKSALFTYDLGDQSVPNPQESALIRAAGMFSNSTLYRPDLAAPVAGLICCQLPADSHGFLVDLTNPATIAIADAAQQEMVGFLASDGTMIPDANAALQKLDPYPINVTIFDTPGLDLETLNFGTLGISNQENLTLDQTPTIASAASATGIKGSVQPSIQAGSWVAIYGFYLANTTADWTGLIGSNGQLPTSIGGVSVTIGGKPAYIYYVSPGQINVVAPDIAAGDVPVVVTTQGVRTAAVTVHAASAAPGFFQWGASQYALTTRYPDNAFVANPSLGTGYVAAEPGDVLILWATGFGPTTPAQIPGVLASGTHNVAPPVKVTVGGVPVSVIGAALSPGLAGVYQIAIQLPDSVPSGEVLIKATVGGFNTPDNVYLFIGP